MIRLSLFRNGALVAASLVALTMPANADRGRDSYRGGHSGVVLHADAGFRGEAIQVDGAIPDLKPMRFNDRISSISIRSGAWEVCADANFRGRCAIIDTSVSRLNDLRLNDSVSSLRPVGYGYGGDRGRSVSTQTVEKQTITAAELAALPFGRMIVLATGRRRQPLAVDVDGAVLVGRLGAVGDAEAHVGEGAARLRVDRLGKRQLEAVTGELLATEHQHDGALLRVARRSEDDSQHLAVD